ncbi:MAG TPA: acetyl-CoA carboxylase biotin carboxylase subunit, partial [Ramlibacter sp.]
GGWGVRIDTHARTGYRVPAYYDSMVAKLIVHGASREDALTRLRVALGELRVDGIATNIPLHRELAADPNFAEGGVDIHYLERWLQERPAA